MKRIIALLAVAALLLTPAAATLSVAVFLNPATTACSTGSLTVGEIPDSLTATTKNGEQITLTRAQLTHAATIIAVGGQTDGVERAGVTVALMAALTESSLRMLANTGTYPESGDYPHDGDASDHDSLGLFQMRPQSGWGTVAQLMDPRYQARAFYGGPQGPNGGSPRGLLDIPGWKQMDPGTAAQSVEVSAFPTRYQNYEPVAETILTTLTRPRPGTGKPGSGTTTVAETSRVVAPMPAGVGELTSRFGWRTDPVTGARQDFHTGTDFAAPDGTGFLAVADGVVTVGGYLPGWGNAIVIEHTVGGQRVASAYFHMWDHGIHVTPGQHVTAGQHIGDVGSSGWSTGPHLHFEIHPGGWGQPAVDSLVWLQEHGAVGVEAGEHSGARCGA
ncbi:peptidase M23 [Leucobacter sp. UCD-THU]|uniref:M23 family metallopeptidase n=1 Tax=Leucobacter sp. UCD-THU TaxID=1292023 RepID=UPI000379240A|nr:M23 family metallopeptidase [Leucobacter sp. UCD-THU]EYT56583.1 peptidase M23 [Leucobacter sp. UCD-THU]